MKPLTDIFAICIMCAVAYGAYTVYSTVNQVYKNERNIEKLVEGLKKRGVLK